MRKIIIFLLLFVAIISCTNNKNKKTYKEPTHLQKSDSLNKVAIIERKEYNSIYDSIKQTKDNEIENWTDEQKELDIRKYLGLEDSIIILNHYKKWEFGYPNNYMYCYSFIDLDYKNRFRRGPRNYHYNCKSKECQETIKKLDSLNIDLKVIKPKDSLDLQWCRLAKYKNLICATDESMRDLFLDSCFVVEQYMDGPYTRFITDLKHITTEISEIAFVNSWRVMQKGNIKSDSLKIHFLNKEREIAIFETTTYNSNINKYKKSYDLYATPEFCSELPIIVTIETDYDLCGTPGVEYSYDWSKHIKSKNSLKELIQTSIILPKTKLKKSDFLFDYHPYISMASIIGENVELMDENLETVKVLNENSSYQINIIGISDSMFKMKDIVDERLIDFPYYKIVYDTSIYWVSGNHIFGHAGTRTGMVNGKEKYSLSVYKNLKSKDAKCPILIRKRENFSLPKLIPIIPEKKESLKCKYVHLVWNRPSDYEIMKNIVFNGNELRISITTGNQKNETLYWWKISGILYGDLQGIDKN